MQCPDCGFVFASVVPPNFADASFYENEGAGFYASEDKLRGDYSPVRYVREIRLFQRFCPTGAVLDVGCSTGGFLHRLQHVAPGKYDAAGTDVATGALDVAEKHGVRVIRGSFLDRTFPERDLDAITFWAVLEHVLEPAVFLRQAHALLRERGYCFVLVPNIRSLATRLLGAKYRYILPQHLNYFSNATLRTLCGNCGFDVIHETTMHFNPAVIARDFFSHGDAVSDRERAELLLKTNALKTNPFLAPIKAVYSLCEKALGGAGLADNVALVLQRR